MSEDHTRLADGEWHRLHPLTPVARSWRILIVVLIFFGHNATTGADSWITDLRNSASSGQILGIAGLVVLLILAGGLVLAYFWWRVSRFRVTDESLELYQGILFRQHRSARLDRVQTIEVAQPFIARLTGLARLTLEVAGGHGSNVRLEFLTEYDAQRLRNHLLARAAGLSYAEGEAPEAPEQPAIEVPVTLLLSSLALSGVAIVMAAVLVVLIALSVAAHSVGPFFGTIPALLGGAGLIWGRFNGGFNFALATSPDGLRLRYGLLEHRAQTVPPGRVQAVRLTQPLLWRTVDWWTVEVNIAGRVEGHGQQEHETGHRLLPVGTRRDAVYVLSLVLPDLGVPAPADPWKVIDAGLTGSSPDEGYLVAPKRARWVDPIGWRRTGVQVTSQALLIRRGRILRKLDVVPHARTQSLGLTQGPLQRRMGVASFELHSTPGPVEPVVPHLDAQDAARLLAAQALRAEGARGAAGPERWMETAD